MRLRRLRQFEALYRLRSFARAADELGITQPALSRSLQKLEEELGTRLFDRTTHVVEPTETGRRLMPKAEAVLAAAAVLFDEAEELRRPGTGLVRVGSGPFPLQPLVSGAVAALGRRAPGVRVAVEVGATDALLQGLLDRALDLVVCDTSKFRDSAYSGEILVQSLPAEPLMLLFAPDHPAAGSVELRIDAAWPWALPKPAPRAEPGLIRDVGGAAEAGGFPHYRLDSTAACIDIVRTGSAVTAVPASLAIQALEAGGLAWARLPASSVSADGIHLLRNRRRSTAAQLFIDLLKEEAQRLQNRIADFFGPG